ncbi:MAG: bifunctional folylpolyglutamate synthase/dihydrofolate synthase [Aquificae bacterium]|nr:bifunctional folylpolyglutamate synthase/dihydrofolate synthase [Aquificota bacterium]
MELLWSLYRGADWEIKPSLERIRRALRRVGEPHRAYPSLVVGGTNGKGSSCAFTERILREHGLKTGWFVSPHLITERERWRINGVPISYERARELINGLLPVIKAFRLTYFEAATLVALKLFQEEGVDAAVLEVGMGGRWDATKAAEPVLAAVTNAERDHTKWLGPTVESIAAEKLALFEGVSGGVLGSSRWPLYPKALELGLNGLLVAGQDYEYAGVTEGPNTALSYFRSPFLTLDETPLSLWGRWQADNAATAVALSSLFIKLSPEKVKRALSSTVWEGRMEVIRRKPLLMLDASHNPYAVAKVAREVSRHFSSVTPAFSSLKGKEWELSLSLLRRYFNEILIVPIEGYERAEEPERMLKYALKLGFRAELVTVKELITLERDLLVLGSIYLIARVKELFGRAYGP